MRNHLTSTFLISQGLSKTFPERFWKYVTKTKSCWLWSGAISDSKGWKCGVITKGCHKGGMLSAHRASWILHHGIIPLGLCVLHHCPNGDNSLCVNPSHLYLGTPKDNMRDALRDGRRKTGEQSYKAKIRAKDVLFLRASAPHGKRKLKIARELGISLGHLNNILAFRCWNHI